MRSVKSVRTIVGIIFHWRARFRAKNSFDVIQPKSGP